MFNNNTNIFKFIDEEEYTDFQTKKDITKQAFKIYYSCAFENSGYERLLR